MKRLLIAALAVLLATGCDKRPDDASKQLTELERKASEAIERQQELERQLEDQRLAAERDAIERERMQIDEARAELERQQGASAAAEAEKIRLREEALAAREGTLEAQQEVIAGRENQLRADDESLSERDSELAGLEAISSANSTWEETEPVGDYRMFYDSLSSYGSWFDTPDYGYVWQPVVIRDNTWRPYTRGRWACSDYGWTWISDEPFGWATYHYGRWAMVRGVGWVWVPGSEWAPSWVSWRSSSSHIGWAPLPPETLAYRRHHWDSTVDVTFGINASWFNFVEIRDFDRPIRGYCLPYTQNNVFIRQTVNITNIHVQDRRIISGGPKYADLNRKIGRKLPFYRLEVDRSGRPGRDPISMQPRVDGQRLRVAAPAIDVPWNEGLKPARVKGRLEAIQLERNEAIRPEITDRFRKTREEGRNKAEQAVAELGGREQFNKRRMEQLESNRRRNDEKSREKTVARDLREIPQAPDRSAERPERGTAEPKTAEPLVPNIGPEPVKPDAPPTRDNRPQPIRENRKALEEVPKKPEKPLEEEQSRSPGPLPQPTVERDLDRDPSLPPKPEETARIKGQGRQEQAENARSEKALQQQLEIKSKEERVRNEQSENARREQALQQQQLETQRLEEQARQEQMENARREQAQQQQQMEAQRQEEQARQEQMENARRQQAQQQQQMEARRQEEQARQQQRQKEFEPRREELEEAKRGRAR